MNIIENTGSSDDPKDITVKDKDYNRRISQIELTDDQQTALEKICTFIEDKIEADKSYDMYGDVIRLAGYAGTGKTTIIGEVCKELLEHVDRDQFAFCTYTNKAWEILKEKLEETGYHLREDDYINTLHSFLYESYKVEKGGIPEGYYASDILNRIEKADHDIAMVESQRPYDTDVMFIDEASMVSEKIFKQVNQFSFPIVAIGDHGQLPPINETKSDFSLMKNPDIKLEKIHRQARDSEIIQLGEYVRNEGTVDPNLEGDEFTILGSRDFFYDIDYENCVFLSYKNKTRIRLNKCIRRLNGIKDPDSILPKPGEEVVCLQSSEEDVHNGMRGVVVNREQADTEWHLNMEIDFYNDITYKGPVVKDQFNTKESLDKYKLGMPKHEDLGARFDYGYALTVHKAIGSEFENVCLVLDGHPGIMDFDTNDLDAEEYFRRWLYTGVTRASDHLYLVHERNVPQHNNLETVKNEFL